MIKKFENLIKNTFKNLDRKTISIMQKGFKFCFLVLLLSTVILATYLFFIHNFLVYEIGLLVFQLGLYFAIDFVIAGIAIDTIKKQMI